MRDPDALSHSHGDLLPEGHDADAFRNLSAGTSTFPMAQSFGPLVGRYFRIGHLGDTDELMLMGALTATEMTLALAGIPHKKGGMPAAMDYIVSAEKSARVAAE